MSETTVITRDECEKCGSDMDSLARPGECADDRCRGRMVVVEYLPADRRETARCQHCPCLADERSFMCSDCASEADFEVQTLRDRVEALKARLRQEVDAHRMTLHEHALPFTDEEWQGYLGTIPGLEEGT